MKRGIILAIIISTSFILIAVEPFGSSGATGTTTAIPTWTIMVYMADDYPVTLSWQDDINEMEAAQQAPGTNIIALVDQYGPNNTMLLKVAHDPNFLNPTIVSQPINDGGAVISGGEVNMASPSTLDAFIRFAQSSYPADRLVLILWGHGASWQGLCPDGADIMTLPELSTALGLATSSMGRALDMIVVDSCAEASIEMFAQLRGYTTLFVGSEKDVPFQGLPYVLVMNDLAADPAQALEEFGARIVDDYVTWSITNSDYSTTMGVFNITKLDDLLVRLDALSLVGERYDQIFHQAMRSALDSSEQYEDAFRVDFANLMWSLSSSDLPLELKYAALQCYMRVNEVVEHFEKFSNLYATDGILVTNATGLAIYPPSGALADVPYSNLVVAGRPWYGFGRLLRNDTITSASAPGPAVNLSASEIYDTALYPQPPIDTARLTWPITYDKVQAFVFRRQSDGLVLAAKLESPSAVIEFESPGSLIVAASAETNGRAVSYCTLNLTLEGSSGVYVNVLKDGKIVGNIPAQYTVKLISKDGINLGGGYAGQTDTFVSRIRVPEDSSIGDLLTVEVRDKSSGELVGRSILSVSPVMTTVQVDVWSPDKASGDVVIPIAFAALPGLLVLGFALMLYRQERNRIEGKG